MATPQATPYASASLYVGDLAMDVTEALLFEIFNAVGPVASVRVCRDASTRRSLGYAYVNFHRVEDAERALDTMNFKAIRSRPCRIMWSHRDPSLRTSGRGNIFIKNLAPSIDNKSLYDTFSLFGNILSCKVATNQKGESLKYGFVQYEGEESANTAIARVNGKVIAGETVTVSAFKSRKERGNGGKSMFTNVYVKNVPSEWDDEKLSEVFSKHGSITSCKVSLDKEGKHRGFGFVNFQTPEAATEACEALNDFQATEKLKLVVVRAQKKEEREKELRIHFEQLKVERQKKYAGVNLYVKNLSDTVDEAKLREEFGKFGEITSARVMVEASGKSKGFGFVCFSTPEEATAAVQEMNNKLMDQKPLYVALAQNKDVRRQQLENQYASRVQGMPMGQMGGQMYPNQPGPPPMGFYPGVPQQRMVYPPQAGPMMARGWNGQGPVMAMGPPGNYQLRAAPMRVRTQRQPRVGGRGGGQNGGRGKGAGAPGNFKYVDNVRNQGGPPRSAMNPIPMMQQQQVQQPQQPVEQATAAEPLNMKDLASALASAPEDQKKQMIGERLFPLIQAQQPASAGKITGMLLEMDNGELLHLIESDAALSEKVDEAMMVLQNFNAGAE